MRETHTNITTASVCEVSDPSVTIEIHGHDLLHSRGEATGLKTLKMDALQLIDYVKVLYAKERAANTERLRWRVRLGAVLLQVRARTPHGAWNRWLETVRLHKRSAQRAMTTATRLADVNGELSTERLRECLQLAAGVDMPPVSEHRVDDALTSRKEYTPAHAARPFSPRAQEVFAAIDAPRYAKGAAPVIPVIVDGAEQPGITFNRRAAGDRIEVSAREVQIFTGPQIQNRSRNATNVSRPVAHSFGEKRQTLSQMKFDGMYRAAECVRGALGVLTQLEAVDVPANLRDLVTAESEAFGKRISELCGGLCSGLEREQRVLD